MGADMLMVAWTVRAGKTPTATRRKALKLLGAAERGIKAAKTFDKDFMEQHFWDSENVERVREILLRDVEEIRQAVKGVHRQAAWLCCGEYNLLVTGGLSWGDDPVELYGSMNRVLSSGFMPYSTEMPPSDLLQDKDTQFPRLISELHMAGALTEDVMKHLCESMELTQEQVFSIVRCAAREWDRIKKARRG